MKRLLTTLMAAAVVVACAKKVEETYVAPEPETNVMLEEPSGKGGEEAVAETPEAKGQKLVEGGDCMGCHKIDTKLVGPAFQDVAAKYTEADAEKLAKKIIDGGAGNWGEVPMTPHAGLSVENAKLMVAYVLSQKK